MRIAVAVDTREGTRALMGERLIVAYKFGKAALEAGAAVAMWFAVTWGLAGELGGWAAAVAHRSVHPLTLRIAHGLGLLATPARLHVLALLLGGDAVVSAAEGWVLRRGYPWGRWIVVFATGLLLPLELREIVRHPDLVRAVVFVINGAIVVYLATRIRRRGAPAA